MKIAIYIPLNYHASEGGGFSYVEQICMSLLENSTKDIQIVPFFIKNKQDNLDNSYFFRKIAHKYEHIVHKNSAKKVAWWLRGMRFLTKTIGIKQVSYLFDEAIKIVQINLIKNEQIEVDKTLNMHNIHLLYYPLPSAKLHEKLPFVSTVWDLIHLKAPFLPEITEDGQFELREQTYHDTLRQSAFIVCESEQGKNELERFYNLGQNKIKVLPMFPSSVIDINITKEEKEQWLAQNGLEEKLFVFYPAQFWPHKNHITLIKALQILKVSHNIHLKLVLTGGNKGNLNYCLEWIKRLNLENEVKYLGFVQAKEIRILYDSALALVMCTLYDPTSIPVVEALACACPVVCTDTEGHREQAGDGALYVNALSAEDIANKIAFLYNNSQERELLIQKGTEFYKNSENKPQNSVEKLHSFFEEFMQTRNIW